MQIVSWRQFAWNEMSSKSFFLAWKNNKKYIKMLFAENFTLYIKH